MISLTGRPDNGISNAATTGSLRDPGGPKAGSTAPPSFAELRNPSLSNSTVTFDTNTTASLPLLIRPWANGYEKGIRQGSIIFASREDCNASLCTAADIPTLNYVLENSIDTDQGRQLPATLRATSQRDFEDTWNLFGIMRNDMMADSQLQKLYNCDVFGRSMVANMFTPKLSRGDHVGLALIELDDIHASFSTGYKYPDSTVLPAVLTSGKCLQVVGTCNGEIDPKVVAKSMQVTNATGTTTTKPNYNVLLKIPLGVVSHAVAKRPSPNLIRRALRESDQYILLPRVEILMI